MDCKETRNIMVEYYYDELSAEKKKEAADHLASCAECAKEYTAVKSALETASKVMSPVMNEKFWNDYSSELAEKIRKREAVKVWRLFRMPLAAAGIAALALFAVITLSRPAAVQLQEIDAVYLLSEGQQGMSAETAELEVELLADPYIMEDLITDIGS